MVRLGDALKLRPVDPNRVFLGDMLDRAAGLAWAAAARAAMRPLPWAPGWVHCFQCRMPVRPSGLLVVPAGIAYRRSERSAAHVSPETLSRMCRDLAQVHETVDRYRARQAAK